MKIFLPILSITGSDCAGKTGIQADVRTITDLGGYALTAISCIATSTERFGISVDDIPEELVIAQIKSVVSRFHPLAVKVGWVRKASTVKAVRNEIVGCRNIVCSPGVLSSDGKALADEDTLWAIMHYLLPEVRLLMLRCAEAEIMLDMKIATDDDMLQAAEKFRQRGAEWVLLRGGRQVEGQLKALLYGPSCQEFFTSYNIEGWQRHGVGGALSSAITTRLAMGDDMKTAVNNAHDYIHSQVVYSVSNERHGYRSADLYNRFLSLVADRYREAHDVAYYADKLSISTRYLSQTTERAVGKSPKHIIAEYLVAEAKVLLSTTRLPIQTISDRLGFSSQSAFSKFFQNVAKCPPTSFR